MYFYYVLTMVYRNIWTLGIEKLYKYNMYMCYVKIFKIQ